MSDRKVVRKMKRVLLHYSVSVRLEGCEIMKRKQVGTVQTFYVSCAFPIVLF